MEDAAKEQAERIIREAFGKYNNLTKDYQAQLTGMLIEAFEQGCAWRKLMFSRAEVTSDQPKEANP